jgi:hypothetical protein
MLLPFNCLSTLPSASLIQPLVSMLGNKLTDRLSVGFEQTSILGSFIAGHWNALEGNFRSRRSFFNSMCAKKTLVKMMAKQCK